MHGAVEPRTYERNACVVFRKTGDRFGGLSNMASGYPICLNETYIATSEALYQACRFPHLPDVQRKIIGETSPMTAKMRGKPHRKDTRADWEEVRVMIMRWSLRAKLIQNWDKFRTLLLLTDDSPIVEDSRRDRFWGAVVGKQDVDILEGCNVLGRLLMELREQVRDVSADQWRALRPLEIRDFLLLGEPIRVTHREDSPTRRAGQLAF